jgi:triosephosphate isomerase (TIM)
MQTWVIGNWKMNGSLAQVKAFVPALRAGLPARWQQRGLRIALCPPLPYLAALGGLLQGSGVALGAQKVYPLPSGAFTGEVSPPMLKEFGVTLCIVGHSEHRQHFGVTDAFIAEKLHGLLGEGIQPILCVGETLAEREAGRQEAVIETQLLEALQAADDRPAGKRRGDISHLPHPALSTEQGRRLIVAYEPVWAIGTGVNATPEQANEMHGFIRGLLSRRFDASTAAELPLLYGGSVNPGNARTLLAQSEINGALVGGASLKPETFLPIIAGSLD